MRFGVIVAILLTANLVILTRIGYEHGCAKHIEQLKANNAALEFSSKRQSSGNQTRKRPHQ